MSAIPSEAAQGDLPSSGAEMPRTESPSPSIESYDMVSVPAESAPSSCRWSVVSESVDDTPDWELEHAYDEVISGSTNASDLVSLTDSSASASETGISVDWDPQVITQSNASQGRGPNQIESAWESSMDISGEPIIKGEDLDDSATTTRLTESQLADDFAAFQKQFLSSMQTRSQPDSISDHISSRPRTPTPRELQARRRPAPGHPPQTSALRVNTLELFPNKTTLLSEAEATAISGEARPFNLKRIQVPVPCFAVTSFNKVEYLEARVLELLCRILSENPNTASNVEVLVLDLWFVADWTYLWQPGPPHEGLKDLISRCDRVGEVWLKVDDLVPEAGGLTACLDGKPGEPKDWGTGSPCVVTWTGSSGSESEGSGSLFAASSHEVTPPPHTRPLSRMHTLTIDASAQAEKVAREFKPDRGPRNVLYWCPVELPTNASVEEYGLHILSHGRVGEYRNLKKLNLWGVDIDILSRRMGEGASGLVRPAYCLTHLDLRDVKFVRSNLKGTGTSAGNLGDLLGGSGILESLRLEKVQDLGEEELVAILNSHGQSLRRLELIDCDFRSEAEITRTEAKFSLKDVPAHGSLSDVLEGLYALEVVQASRLILSSDSSLEDVLQRICCPVLRRLTIGRGLPDLPGTVDASLLMGEGSLLPTLPKAAPLPDVEQIVQFVLNRTSWAESDIKLDLVLEGAEKHWSAAERNVISQACEASGVGLIFN